MQPYEYTVIPAPSRGEKARGARTGAERFSYALTVEMNRMAANGWEYVRAETLPCEERSGLTSRTTVYHNVLVFRRALAREVTRLEHGRSDDGHSEAQPEPRATQLRAEPALAPPARPQPATAEPPANWPDGQSPASQRQSVTQGLRPQPAAGGSEPAPVHRPAPTPAPPPAPGPDQQPHPAPVPPRPQPAAGWTVSETDLTDEGVTEGDDTGAPGFIQRAPLSAPREDTPRGVFSSAMPAGRLGPAER